MGEVFTIGCSVHTLEAFAMALKKNKITMIADVRSQPYSRYAPQFNKESLSAFLRKYDIEYLHMGAEFGARRDEPEAYTDNRVDFHKTSKLAIFNKGIEKIEKFIDSYSKNIALMCTEKNPLECHRFLLVARNIVGALQINANHILFDGSVLSQKNLEQKMLKEQGIGGLFLEDALDSVYEVYSAKIAYKKGEAYDE
ncbi:MAG: DUF488 domain-containing protein [Helicobacteraceae bacterium]|jgi:uncharacterized protein (DUF488 family)|nr:DUF488 domain-containing protein [Helicobacteraceae bacterium]